jgi:hypothetical protein
MRFEKQIGSVTFYYELTGKQDNNLFPVKFSYGTVKNVSTDTQIHQEIASCETFDEMQTMIAGLQKYCENLEFKKVKSTKRKVIT